MLLPLAICGVCIVTSIIGTFGVRLGKSNNIMGALYQGLIITGVLSAVAIYWVIKTLVTTSMTVGDKSFDSVNGATLDSKTFVAQRAAFTTAVTGAVGAAGYPVKGANPAEINTPLMIAVPQSGPMTRRSRSRPSCFNATSSSSATLSLNSIT